MSGLKAVDCDGEGALNIFDDRCEHCGTRLIDAMVFDQLLRNRTDCLAHCACGKSQWVLSRPITESDRLHHSWKTEQPVGAKRDRL